jgi:hypothetical protein
MSSKLQAVARLEEQGWRSPGKRRPRPKHARGSRSLTGAVLVVMLNSCSQEDPASETSVTTSPSIDPPSMSPDANACADADGCKNDAKPTAGSPADATTLPRTSSAPATPMHGSAKPAQCAQLVRAELERQVGFPGAGHQLDVRLVTKDGVLQPATDFAPCMQLRDAQSTQPITAAVVQHPAEAAFTLLLVAAGPTPDASAEAQSVADALLTARPSDERIAIYRWGEDVVQLDNFGTDRTHSRDQLHMRLGTRTGAPLPIEQALAAVRTDLLRLEDDAVAALRSVVVIAPEAEIEAVPQPDATGSVSVLWLVRSATSAASAAADRGSIFTLTSPEQIAPRVGEVSKHLDLQRTAGFYSLGICTDGTERSLRLELGDTTPTLDLVVKDSLEEEFGGSCDPARIAMGERNYADTLQLRFSPEQRATYDQTLSMLLLDDFVGALQLLPALQPTPVTMHLHGEHSLECARKSFTIDLDRSRGRHLMPSSSTDEYNLIMTCQDEFYIHQLTASQLFRELGLFPLRSAVVELMIDDRSNGTYLLLEKYKEQLIQDFSRVTAVIRRRNDAVDVAPEVKFAAVDEAAALADYAQILPDALRGLSDAALERTLRERMDLDRYLTWIALNNVLGSGDYVDELIFYATETRDPNSGARRSYFTPMAWDTDDTFSPCHDASINALFDPMGLLTCAESDFDRFIFADPHIYALYVDVLSRVLDFATEERFMQTLQHTKDVLYPFLERDSVRTANVEFRDWVPGARSRDDFVHAIDAQANLDLTSLRARRTTLRTNIGRYRATHP